MTWPPRPPSRQRQINDMISRNIAPSAATSPCGAAHQKRKRAVCGLPRGLRDPQRGSVHVTSIDPDFMLVPRHKHLRRQGSAVHGHQPLIFLRHPRLIHGDNPLFSGSTLTGESRESTTRVCLRCQSTTIRGCLPFDA